MQKTTIIHKYAVAPLLAIAAMHAAVWLGSKNLADFSRAFDVTLGLDALIPLRPELAVSDFFTGVLSLVYFFDTPTNCFPSMHCLFAYLVFRQSLSSPGAKLWYRVFCAVFTVLVCLSTLFVKQHVIADVIGGIFFGELAFVLGQKLPVWKIFIKINKKLLQSAP